MKKIIKITICLTACLLLAISSGIVKKEKPQTVHAGVEVDPKDWVTYLKEPDDYAYSFAIVGDTQYNTMYEPQNLTTLYSWIVDNAEAKKIKQVIGVGDITHTDSAVEWAHAHKAISLMNNKVPYTLVRGNHDNRATYYDYYFGRPGAYYLNECVDCFESGTINAARNTAHEFCVDNVNYLVIGLDFGAKDDVLQWANKVVENYPSHTVIITTHAYLSNAGVFLDGSVADSPSRYDASLNDADDMWNKFIKKHKNISLVLSGHVFNENILMRTDVGDNGNVVTSLMVNPQYYEYNKNNTYVSERLTAMVAICYCSADGKTVDVQWYSPIKQKFFRPNVNAFTFDMHVAEKTENYLSVRTVGAGTVTPSFTQLNGEPVTINFTPDKYYNLTKVTLDGRDITSEVVNNSYTLTQTKPYHHVIATFADEDRCVLLEKNDLSMGRINYSTLTADATHKAGENLWFTVKPNQGYAVGEVFYNGEAIFADDNGRYQITVTQNENVLEVKYISAQTQGESATIQNAGANVIAGGLGENIGVNNLTNPNSNNHVKSLTIGLIVIAAVLAGVSVIILKLRFKRR